MAGSWLLCHLQSFVTWCNGSCVAWPNEFYRTIKGKLNKTNCSLKSLLVLPRAELQPGNIFQVLIKLPSGYFLCHVWIQTLVTWVKVQSSTTVQLMIAVRQNITGNWQKSYLSIVDYSLSLCSANASQLLELIHGRRVDVQLFTGHFCKQTNKLV